VTVVAHKQLRHVFAVTSGATPDSGNAEYWDGDILWATPEDISSQDSYWLRDTRRKITQAGYESCGTATAPAGSIVLTKRAPIGQLAVLAEEACSNQGCFLLTPRRATDTRFFYYWLSAQTARLQVLGRGSTFMELSTDELKSLNVPHPPLPRQCAIADHLDRETTRLDALMAAKESGCLLLAEKRRALITRAVTRGLDPRAPLRDSGIPWLGKIPAHWETRRVAWLFRERDKRGEPELPLLEVSINAGVVLREFSEDRIESTAADFDSYKVARQGDVVFNKMRMWQGAVGVAPEDGLVSPDYTVAAPTGSLSAAYAGSLFRTGTFSAECARQSHGIVWDRLRLYWEGFRDIELPLPPADDQRTILTHIERETAKLDALRAATERTIALLKERRSALIAAAVTGHLPIATEPVPQATAAAVV
jgi:type I restriction enzyme S subunit